MKDLPTRHVSKIGECLTSTSHQQWTTTLSRARSVVDDGGIVVLLGDRGVGKTQLAVTLCWYAQQGGKGYKYSNAYALFADVKESYRPDSTSSEASVLRRYTSPHLLVVDEFNEASHTSWEGHVLTTVIDRRYGECRPSVIISNYDADKFASAAGDSITSRIEETGLVLTCNWPSLRKEKKHGID